VDDWVETLDNMLKNMRTDLLKGSGKISHDVAEKKAKTEFIKYKKRTKDVLTQVEKDYFFYLPSASLSIKKSGRFCLRIKL
jgi:hypothetical protein